eukprot:scaffold22512_cov18-Tisochrysis_lutea.AAC.2
MARASCGHGWFILNSRHMMDICRWKYGSGRKEIMGFGKPESVISLRKRSRTCKERQSKI